MSGSNTVTKMQPGPSRSTCSTPAPELEEDESSSIRDDENELFERRKHTIQTSWQAVRFGLDVKATKIFYDRLFEEYPAVRPMFQDDMEVQYNKLFQAVSLAVNFLDDVDELIPVLQELGERHVGYGVVRAHYDAVTECFIWTLSTYIFSQMPTHNALNWIFEVSDAWEWVLTFIGNVMADAADELIEKRHKDRIKAKRSTGIGRTTDIIFEEDSTKCK